MMRADFNIHNAKRLLSAVAMVLTLATVAEAMVPMMVPVQGVLRDNNGLPVSEGAFSMTFALYDALDAESPVWTETWPEDAVDCITVPEGCVAVVGGRFQVALGTHSPLDVGLLAGPEMWLGVSVEGEPELPRRPLGSSPFAMRAAHAGALDCSGCLEMDALSEEALEGLTAHMLEAVGEMDSDINEDALPPSGLDEISGGLLTTELSHVFSQPAPVAILDNNPLGVTSSIEVPNMGTVIDLKVHVAIENSDVSGLTVRLYDPEGEMYLLFDQGGEGTSLEAVFPSPDATLSGDLSTWKGLNAQGTWSLEVVDDLFLSNTEDGRITDWAVELVISSNSIVRATQDVEVIGSLSIDEKASIKGNLSVGGDVQIGSNGAACTPERAGTLHYEASEGRLYLCTGAEVLKVKVCSTTCDEPEVTACGQPLTDECGDICDGSGTGLNLEQCAIGVAQVPCQEQVIDSCNNTCPQTGSAPNPAICADPGTVTCGEVISDPCGNACGTTGTAFSASQCKNASEVSCGQPITDDCQNPCSGQGTACSSGVCLGGQCGSINTPGSILSGSEFLAPEVNGYSQCAGFTNTSTWDILTTDWIHSCGATGKTWKVRVYDGETVVLEDTFPSFTPTELTNNMSGCDNNGYGTCGKLSTEGTGRALLVYKPDNGNGGCHGDDNSSGAVRIANSTNGDTAMGDNYLFLGGKRADGSFRNHNNASSPDSEMRFPGNGQMWDGCNGDARVTYSVAIYVSN